jgi:hypothetical protein
MRKKRTLQVSLLAAVFSSSICFDKEIRTISSHSRLQKVKQPDESESLISFRSNKNFTYTINEGEKEEVCMLDLSGNDAGNHFLSSNLYYDVHKRVEEPHSILFDRIGAFKSLKNEFSRKYEIGKTASIERYNRKLPIVKGGEILDISYFGFYVIPSGAKEPKLYYRITKGLEMATIVDDKIVFNQPEYEGDVVQLEAGTVEHPRVTSNRNWIKVERNSFAFKNYKRNIDYNEKIKLSVVMCDGTSIQEIIKWKASDVSVISIDDQGYIKGLKQGSAMISATFKSGQIHTGIEVGKPREIKELQVKTDTILAGCRDVIDLNASFEARVIPEETENNKIIYSVKETNAKVRIMGDYTLLDAFEGAKIILKATSAADSSLSKELTIKVV